jgi:hypothetical protein
VNRTSFQTLITFVIHNNRAYPYLKSTNLKLYKGGPQTAVGAFAAAVSLMYGV